MNGKKALFRLIAVHFVLYAAFVPESMYSQDVKSGVVPTTKAEPGEPGE